MIIERGNNVVRSKPARDWLILRQHGRGTPRTVTDALQQLKREVCERHGITMAGLEGHRRHRKYVAARVEYIQRAYALEQISLPEIGHAINRDHTTVLHHLRKVAR